MPAFSTIIKRIPVIRDYLAFYSVYHEVASFPRFLRYRYFPFFSKNIYWPFHKRSEVRGKILIGKGAGVGHRPGCIIQGRGKVFIGDYVGIGPNVVIISGNHGLQNQSSIEKKETIIGDYCWLASSCIVLAGVVLGPRTIVGAGSVVTKSFPDGYCVIAGNPARVIKSLSREEFVKDSHSIEYYGYIRSDKFLDFRKKHLSHLSFDYDLSRVTHNNDLYD